MSMSEVCAYAASRLVHSITMPKGSARHAHANGCADRGSRPLLLRTGGGLAVNDSGMTLVETLIAVSIALVGMGAMFAFLDSATRSATNDQERNISLVEETAALHGMVQELAQAYQLNAPTSVGTSNVVDVKAWLTKPSGSQQNRRVVYNCAVASPVAGQQECKRYEMPSTDETSVASLPTDANAHASVAIPRLVNGTNTALVFSFASPRGSGNGVRPSYGTVTLITPGAGERARITNAWVYKHNLTLTEAFYMRNLDFGQ
jgi:Tfp pilus assembly protein PilV